MPVKPKEDTYRLNIQQFKTEPVIKTVQKTPEKALPKKVTQKPMKRPVQKVAPKKKQLDTKKRLDVEKKLSEENNSTHPLVKPKKIVSKKHVDKNKAQKKRPKRKKTLKKRSQRKDALANALMGFGNTKKVPKATSSTSTMIKRLYGSEFNSFTRTQQKFIEKNLGPIHQITQNTLTRNGYPEVAIRTKQKGTAIVTFYLHPNGNISGLRLKKHIGYDALDSNTLKVIRIAYKDYPRPKTKTKITFYVMYRLY